MKSEVPFNNVPHDYNAVLDIFLKRLADNQAENLQAVLLTGSYARGDATPSSDLDVWCLFRKINHTILTSVGEIVRSLPVQYEHLEVNAQCLTLSEFECGHFSSFVSPSIIHFESVLLYGDYMVGKPSPSEIENTFKRILAEVLLSVRHYICVDEPKENLTYRKMSAFILKPLMFALRLERFLNAGSYPSSTKNLLQACSSDYTMLVEWFVHKDILEQAIADNHHRVLFSMSDLIENLL